MREILLHNKLGGRTEPFVPLHPGEVRIYTCGPTVYDFAHIGNFRTFVFQDILRRFLRSQGYKIVQVMNLTDVDDRIIKRAAEAGVSIRQYTDDYIRAFTSECIGDRKTDSGRRAAYQRPFSAKLKIHIRVDAGRGRQVTG